MANTTRLPPPHSMNAQETSSAPRLANESRPTPTSGACRVPHPQASTTSIVHSATTEHGTLKYSRPPRQSWLHSDIPFRLISTEIVGPFKASPWSPRPRENKAAQSNAAKAQLAAPLPSTHLNDLKITATLASQASSNKTTVTAAIIMNQELPSVKASTSGYKARRRTLGSGCLAQMKQLTSPVNAATFDKVPSPKKRTSASVATLDGLPVRTNSAEVITTAESLTPPPTPHRTAVSVPTPVPQTTLIGITASVSRRADANASDDSQTAINGNSVVKGCAVTTSVATNASGLRKLTAYAPPALPVRPGPRMMSVSDVQPILATHSHQKNPPRLATFSARRSAAKLTMHRRRSSVPNVPYYYKSNGKIQMTLPLVSRNPTTPITSDALSTSEITGFRKHSLDSSMDRLISSESLKAPRTTLTVDQRQKQARQKPRMSSTTSIRRLSLPTTSPTLRGTPAPGPVTSAPIVKQSSQRTGKSNSILVAAVNAFPEFRAQNEEFQHLAAKQHAKVQSAKSTSEYANANGARGSSVAVDVKTANISAVAGADVRNMNQNAGEEGPLFDMGRHSVETASRALFVPSVPEQHLRSLSIKMDLVERIPETPTNPPPAPSSSSMASDDGLIFGVSAPVKEKRKSQEGPETSRKSVWSHREGADSKTSSRKSPSKRRLKIGRSTSPKSSPSITSSAAFEANMFDIEQYVDQDLQGYYRLSY